MGFLGLTKKQLKELGYNVRIPCRAGCGKYVPERFLKGKEKGMCRKCRKELKRQEEKKEKQARKLE